MKNLSKSATFSPDRTHELRKELARKIALFIGSAEKRITDVPGLLLTRRTAPTAPASAAYEPSLAVVAQGRKRATLGGTTFIFDESRYLLTSLDLPVICNVIEASEEMPYLCFRAEARNSRSPRASEPRGDSGSRGGVGQSCHGHR